MSTVSSTTKNEALALADNILNPVLSSDSIEINNVTVSFKTPSGVYTAVKEISLSVSLLFF